MPSLSSSSSTSTWLTDQLDFISFRISSAVALGGVSGWTLATYRGGQNPMVGRTIFLTGISCGMAATVCFGAERLAAITLSRIQMMMTDDSSSSLAAKEAVNNNEEERSREIYNVPVGLEEGTMTTFGGRSIDPKPSLASHCIGGIVGGGILGFLYRNKPVKTALALTPIMLAIGWGQNLYENARQERILQQQQEQLLEDPLVNELELQKRPSKH